MILNTISYLSFGISRLFLACFILQGTATPTRSLDFRPNSQPRLASTRQQPQSQTLLSSSASKRSPLSLVPLLQWPLQTIVKSNCPFT